MGLTSQLKRLLRNSLITGVPQIVVTRNLCKKYLKIMIFFGCMTGFFWQTSTFLEVYWTYPTVVDVEYLFPDEFELPAVSVCSYNSIKSNVFCNRFPAMCYPNTSLDEFCTKNSYYCDPNHESPENESYPTVTPEELPDLPRTEYQKMGISADEMVTQCTVYEAPRLQDCTNKYQNVNVFDTKGLPSNCYSYNSLWGETRGAKLITTQTMIVLRLKTDKSHNTQFYTSSPFAIQMSLHNPYVLLNPFRDGFSINPCSNYFIFPSKQVNKLLPPPYTSACYNYTATWEARSGKGPLTKRLCAEECILNKSLEAVGCVDPFFITYPNMEHICKSIGSIVNEALLSSIQDTKRCVVDKWYGFLLQIRLSLAVSPVAQFLYVQGPYFCGYLLWILCWFVMFEAPSRELYKSCSNYCRPACYREDINVDIQEHSHFSQRGKHKENVCYSMIVIAFNRMELVKYSYSPKYESVSLFSYIGGYLGLWLGISLVAISDVIETVVLLVRWIVLKSRKRRKTKNRVQSQQRVVFDESSGQMYFM